MAHLKCSLQTLRARYDVAQTERVGELDQRRKLQRTGAELERVTLNVVAGVRV